jgi:hypothetical protein
LTVEVVLISLALINTVLRRDEQQRIIQSLAAAVEPDAGDAAARDHRCRDTHRQVAARAQRAA